MKRKRFLRKPPRRFIHPPPPFKEENNLAVVLTHRENGESDSMAGVALREVSPCFDGAVKHRERRRLKNVDRAGQKGIRPSSAAPRSETVTFGASFLKPTFDHCL